MKAPLLMLLTATLGLAACASTSAPPSADAPEVADAGKQYRTQSEAEAAVDDNDLICRNEPVLGSRFPKKTCATRAEWEAARASAQDEMRRNQKGAAQPPRN